MQVDYKLNTRMHTCPVYDRQASNTLLIPRHDCFNSFMRHQSFVLTKDCN